MKPFHNNTSSFPWGRSYQGLVSSSSHLPILLHCQCLGLEETQFRNITKILLIMPFQKCLIKTQRNNMLPAIWGSFNSVKVLHTINNHNSFETQSPVPKSSHYSFHRDQSSFYLPLNSRVHSPGTSSRSVWCSLTTTESWCGGVS